MEGTETEFVFARPWVSFPSSAAERRNSPADAGGRVELLVSHSRPLDNIYLDGS